MAAIVGAAGLHPAMAAAKAGKRILLANKETLVMAGNLFMQAVSDGGATLLPIDSEHNAIFQVMPRQRCAQLSQMGVKRVILTASGGPFRTFSEEQLLHVTPKEALRHPNWVMGKKITIDSATMMNKGLEVIEARWLFNVPADDIQVVIHPQSIIHSMVQFADGSLKAQLGLPDMRLPIVYALGYPNRVVTSFPRYDFSVASQFTFEPPDTEKFRNLALAFEALKTGGNCPCVLNAANEVAVNAFLTDKISFVGIAHTIEKCLEKATFLKNASLDDYFESDRETRILCNEIINNNK